MKTYRVASLLTVLVLLAAACTPAAAPTEAPPAPAPTEPPQPATTSAGGPAPTSPASAEPTLAKPTSTELNLYGWSDYVPQQLLDDFSAEYGIKVNYDTYSSNEEMLAKLQAGASGYDLVIPSDYTVTAMLNQDLLQPIDLAQIPNFKNLDPRFTNKGYDPGNKYTIPYQWGTTALAYDKTKVPFEPKSWADLWDPKFKGRLVMLDDEREVTGMALQTLGLDKNSTDPAQLDQAKQKMVELKPNIVLFNSDDPETSLITGETWAGLVYNGNAALARQQDPDIEYICPKEGCGLWFDNLAVPKSAPHADAAMAFMNFMLEPKESILITQEFPYSNPNKEALEYLKANDPSTYESYTAFSATNPPDDFLARAVEVKDVGAATTLYDQLWTDFKGQ
ncbi:MAG TPA: spermidine/putrescine ABC transporter substrate-binding protein [Anaerolineales bacterium]|nr:spermidine/putrescine ABC transporter substrate-binding protein [Anaerolineales bacterium]